MNEEINNQEQEVELDVNKLMQVRLEKLEELQKEGKNPYEITKYDRTETSGQIKNNYEEFEGKDVSVAGRIMAKRIMGKASFCTIQDASGKIQSYVSINDLGEESYSLFKTYDIGDIIGIKGFVFKTRTEEISIHAKEVVLLTKSLRPLPEKFHGLTDKEERYRRRYVDLIMNEEARMVCLIKPQFEAGKENVGKKGVVRDPVVHQEVLENFECGMTIENYNDLKEGDMVEAFEMLFHIGKQLQTALILG